MIRLFYPLQASFLYCPHNMGRFTFGRASIFLREGENVQDEQQDILYRAAEVWKELTEYHYVFTYGYKVSASRNGVLVKPGLQVRE